MQDTETFFVPAAPGETGASGDNNDFVPQMGEAPNAKSQAE
jgi:hypothetical protein